MTKKSHSNATRGRATIWATLTLGIGVTTTGLVAIADAQGGSHHSVRPDRIKNCSASTACIGGSNKSSGSGVEGDASEGYGVLGQSGGQNAGVGGFSFTANAGASGVYGQSTNGVGVYGFSESANGFGVFSQGNAFIQGEIFTSGSCHSGCSRTRHQASFAATTSQPTLDDVGEASLRNGVARVALAPDFANAIDAGKPYVVLLTPEGDASLYVANRSVSGFEVRQIGGGRSSVAFAYRIVAKPYGVRDDRLPFKTLPDASTFNLRHAAR